MSRIPTDALIASLAAQAEPVRPLAPPLRRGLMAVGAVFVPGATVILLFGDAEALHARYAGRALLMTLEMAAMLLTGIVALLGAFFVSIPGRSRKWLLASLPFLVLWVGLSGFGCYQDFVRTGPHDLAFGDSVACLKFLLGAGLLVGAPLLWLLARARPVDPLPVAALGGLGGAAVSAFLLQFFHPVTLTIVDLGVHFFAVLLIVAVASASRRLTLKPA